MGASSEDIHPVPSHRSQARPRRRRDGAGHRRRRRRLRTPWPPGRSRARRRNRHPGSRHDHADDRAGDGGAHAATRPLPPRRRRSRMCRKRARNQWRRRISPPSKTSSRSSTPRSAPMPPPTPTKGVPGEPHRLAPRPSHPHRRPTGRSPPRHLRRGDARPRSLGAGNAGGHGSEPGRAAHRPGSLRRGLANSGCRPDRGQLPGRRAVRDRSPPGDDRPARQRDRGLAGPDRRPPGARSRRSSTIPRPASGPSAPRSRPTPPCPSCARTSTASSRTTGSTSSSSARSGWSRAPTRSTPRGRSSTRRLPTWPCSSSGPRPAARTSPRRRSTSRPWRPPIDEALAGVDGVADDVLPLTPADWNDGTAGPILRDARQAIVDAKADLRTAMAEARQVIAALAG